MQRVQARGRGRLVSAGITTAATQQNVNIPFYFGLNLLIFTFHKDKAQRAQTSGIC